MDAGKPIPRDLGFVAESLRDSRNSLSEMHVMISHAMEGAKTGNTPL